MPITNTVPVVWAEEVDLKAVASLFLEVAKCPQSVGDTKVVGAGVTPPDYPREAMEKTGSLQLPQG